MMKRKGSKGMTILETFIALMVLGVIIIGVLGGLYLAGYIGATTMNRTKALQIVKGEMEEVMATSYASLVDSGENGYLHDNPDRYPYSLTTSVDPEYEGGQEIGKVVTVRIEWLQNNRNCHERLVTFRRK